MRRFLADTAMLATIFAVIMLSAMAARAERCTKWVETRDGRDVQTNEPVVCDGVHGPLEQFSELLKCAKSDLPVCERKRLAETDKAAKVVTALRKDVQIESKRADAHKGENAKLRVKLEELATVEVYEHPAFWAVVGGAVIATVWILVEVAR